MLLEINQFFVINGSIHRENKLILNLHLQSIASKHITQKLKELIGEIDKGTLIINTTEFPNSSSYIVPRNVASGINPKPSSVKRSA